MTAWLAAGGLGLGLVGAIVALYWRWRLQRADDAAKASADEVKRKESELAELGSAALDTQRRQEGAADVLRSERDASRDGAADMARRHPGLASEYLRQQLREAAAAVGETDSRPHAEVPGPAAAAGPAGGDRGRDP